MAVYTGTVTHCDVCRGGKGTRGTLHYSPKLFVKVREEYDHHLPSSTCASIRKCGVSVCYACVRAKCSKRACCCCEFHLQLLRIPHSTIAAHLIPHHLTSSPLPLLLLDRTRSFSQQKSHASLTRLRKTASSANFLSTMTWLEIWLLQVRCLHKFIFPLFFARSLCEKKREREKGGMQFKSILHTPCTALVLIQQHGFAF